MGMTAAAYVRQLKQLLPQGGALSTEPDSNITKLMQAIADELARVDSRGEDLIEETDPRTADETIGEWEEFLGLPDDLVTAIPATLAERRVAITQKLLSSVGQNEAYFISLAAACGYTATVYNYVKEGDIMRVGFRCGDRVFALPWCYAMLIEVSAISGSALSEADFERVIRASTHAHIEVGFTYPP
jgi:uncharacterized protein YmfQ (DUF2313 family)